MARYGKIVLFGFLVWLTPFVVSFLIYPIRDSSRPLFESIMPVVVTVSAVLFSILHFRRTRGDYLKEGLSIGVAWLAINLVLDLLLLMEGPMKMSLADYFADIGLT